MSLLRSSVFIIGAKRLPFGAFGSVFKDKSCTDLAELAAKDVIDSVKLNPELIDSVVFGNVIQSNVDTAYLARHVGLRCKVPVKSPAFTVNRMCGSGFQAIVSGAQEILCGDHNICLVGGSENMSEAPFVVRNARFGTKLGFDYKFEDVLWSSLIDKHTNTPMGITAENLAAKYGITRQQCDDYALSSQQRWKKANDSKVFQSEMTPVVIKSKKGDKIFSTDEHPRETTLESLAKLPPVFKKDGVVTAGTASGVCDGAGALLLASEQAVAKHNLKPLARIVAYASSGCDPVIMGIGPVMAIKKLLDASKMNLNQIDLVEVNEAFAAQYLAVEKELGLDRAKTNLNGGAISIGHPVGASGARIMAHLTHELHRTQKKMALGSACIGGGQGIAVLIERV